MPNHPSFDAPASDWLVYADALQQSGDVCGELIALNEAAGRGEKLSERDAYVEGNATALFGLPLSSVAIEWSLGAERVTVRVGPNDDAAALVGAFLDAPMARLTRVLGIAGLTPSSSDRVDLSGAVAAAVSRLPPTITGLALIDDRAMSASAIVAADYDPDDNLVVFGSLEGLWSIEHLESVELHVADPMQLELGTIKTESLRHFAIYGLRWADAYHDSESALANTLATASWPKLESLALRLPETFTCSVPDNDGAYVRCARYDEDGFDDGYEDGEPGDVNWDVELGPLLESLHQTSIRRLSLHSFESSRGVLDALANGPLPPTLKVLDLSESEVNDHDASWFTGQAERLSGLEVINLESTRMSKRVAATLSKIGPEIRHSSGGSEHRFLVGME